jgi:hypothetical protein
MKHISYLEVHLLQADENTTTIHDYSVRARHVPPDATADEVQKYFEQWGQVSGGRLGDTGGRAPLTLRNAEISQHWQSSCDVCFCVALLRLHPCLAAMCNRYLFKPCHCAELIPFPCPSLCEQVVMVELARKCDELIQLVLERGKVE